ncbi:Translation initiation factor SUI1-related protein [Chitinispirillum alkaliphilum]|nr:Translation initiation factor SUI1-related protein [Chitinispirillum alkaliphilum]
MNRDSKLVYSTDPEKNRRCDRCKMPSASCECKEDAAPGDLSEIKPVLRLERAHRGGKDVTVVDRLPPSETFLKDLAKTLKKRCGSGGTYRISENKGIVEIQGDKRENVKKELGRMGMRIS